MLIGDRIGFLKPRDQLIQQIVGKCTGDLLLAIFRHCSFAGICRFKHFSHFQDGLLVARCVCDERNMIDAAAECRIPRLPAPRSASSESRLMPRLVSLVSASSVGNSVQRFAASDSFADFFRLGRQLLVEGRHFPIGNHAVAHFVKCAVAGRGDLFDFIPEEAIAPGVQRRIFSAFFRLKYRRNQILLFRASL